MTKKFSVRIEDRAAELVITESVTSETLLKVPLTVENIEKLETYLIVVKQFLAGSVRKDAEATPSLWKVETKEAA